MMNYKATRKIEVTFNNGKVITETLVVFDIAIDNARAKLTRKVEHYTNNPCTVEVKNISEYFETL